MDATPTSRSDIIQIIPPELLGEIFAYSSLLDPDAPLILGTVSKTFHLVTRATPQVWTRLLLHVATPPGTEDTTSAEHPDAKWIRKAQLWFAMAGACLVDLHVEMSRDLSTGHLSGQRPSPLDGRSDHSQEEADEWGVLLLPHVLHEFRYRIRGLSLHSNTVDEAQGFFTALYPPPPTPLSPSSDTLPIVEKAPLPLESLVFHAASDGSPRSPSANPRSRSRARPLKIAPVSISVSLSHCHFPHLAHLKFVNHPLPLASSPGTEDVPANNLANVRNLRSLSISYPIRFPSFSVPALLNILASAPVLERLELDGRILASSIPSPTASDVTLSSTHTQNLITLPFLTHLSLRINNLPAILSHLLLPTLHTLHIDDLDGKRKNAASQTAVMLRQLLVRIELPCEGLQRRGPFGLQVLSMCGVALSGGAPSAGPHHAARLAEADRNGKDLTDANAIWDWCFRRMHTLRELRTTKMDVDALLGYITPQMSTGITDDTMLPCLERLIMFDTSSGGTDNPALPHLSLRPHVFGTPSSFGLRAASTSIGVQPLPLSPPRLPVTFNRGTSGPVLKFELRRPDVLVEYNKMQQGPYQPPPNADYLDLFLGL